MSTTRRKAIEEPLVSREVIEASNRLRRGDSRMVPITFDTL